mgnify:CR=1 FL=1
MNDCVQERDREKWWKYWNDARKWWKRSQSRNPVSEVFNSISSESESDEFQKNIQKVSEVEFRGFDFRLVIEWGRVSSFEKLDKKGCFEESSSETSSEVEFLTKVWNFWLQLKSGLQVFVGFCRTKHERSQKYSY